MGHLYARLYFIEDVIWIRHSTKIKDQITSKIYAEIDRVRTIVPYEQLLNAAFLFLQAKSKDYEIGTLFSIFNKSACMLSRCVNDNDNYRAMFWNIEMNGFDIIFETVNDANARC